VLLRLPRSAASAWNLLACSRGRDVAVLDTAVVEMSRNCAVGRTGSAEFSDGA